LNTIEIREHLICDGFLTSDTTCRFHHGRLTEKDKLEDMIRYVCVEAFAQTHVYEMMSSNVESPLYVDTTKFIRLSAVLRLMNLKVTNRWTDLRTNLLQYYNCNNSKIE